MRSHQPATTDTEFIDTADLDGLVATVRRLRDIPAADLWQIA